MKKLQFLAITMLLSSVCAIDAQWGVFNPSGSHSSSSRRGSSGAGGDISALVEKAQGSLGRLKSNLSAEARDALMAFRSDLKSLRKTVKSLSMAEKLAAQAQVKALKDQFKDVLGLSGKPRPGKPRPVMMQGLSGSDMSDDMDSDDMDL